VEGVEYAFMTVNTINVSTVEGVQYANTIFGNLGVGSVEALNFANTIFGNLGVGSVEALNFAITKSEGQDASLNVEQSGHPLHKREKLAPI